MVETAHLVHICRWTAPQPHEATRPREFLEVNESKGNTVDLRGRYWASPANDCRAP